jgi:hypothetical protein
VANTIATTNMHAERRFRIYFAVVRQGLGRGDFMLPWVPSRDNLSDAMTKESDSDYLRLRPCEKMKRPLRDALRSNFTHLRGVRKSSKLRRMCQGAKN